jgi:hypothetical protein
MFKKLIRGLARKLGAKPIMAEAIAEKVDDTIMDVADAKTGGLASKAEELVKERKRKR